MEEDRKKDNRDRNGGKEKKSKGPMGKNNLNGEDIKILEIIGFDDEDSSKMLSGAAVDERDIAREEESVPGKIEDIEALKKEKEELREKLLRRLAEFENYKKRVLREKREYYSNIYAEIVKNLLPILDNFERAFAEPSPEESFREGMELIMNQFRGFLEKEGLVEIEALGEKFDPNLHEAMMMEADPELPEGQIVEVLEKGYTFRGKLVRPSKVKVVRKEPEEEDEDLDEDNG